MMTLRLPSVSLAVTLTAVLWLTGGHPARSAAPGAPEIPSKPSASPKFAPKRGFTVRLLDESTLREAKKWGADIVRIQLPLDHTVKTYNLSWDAAWDKVLADLDAGLDLAKELGQTVVIALPFMGADQYDRKISRWENLEKVWDDDTSLDRMKARWRQIATMCKEKDIVAWYDLLNEPLDRRDWPYSPKKWSAWAQALIDEIRRIDQKSWMVIEPGPGGEMWEGIKNFPLLKDEKLIYSVHLYQPHKYTHQGVHDTQYTDLTAPIMEVDKKWPGEYQDSWGNGLWNKERIEALLKPVHEFSAKHPGIPIYIGEFSVARWAPQAEDYLRDCLEIFERHGWSWTYHALRESHIWSLEHDSTYSLNNPVLAKEQTERGKVVEEFLRLNAGRPKASELGNSVKP
jgi:hypothetical protein